ncbi:hypothetical protein [Solemya velum gill symbiont]|uniref:Uncharacterized protein n=1 Tax=Solemya velum gill symbiont TaxID=2340 RepID=A0A0B0HCX4_SOVGS|nr:hypothetical protein [Solemya velum gill symbiont]KHF26437.1 hypothetical protein JV46_22680 [Solemya velum gill symbiont]OOY35489.1 hypothetical protein BOV88_04385 [Solemya velum gill symbiont]OOY38557.1 hypothetical protein BOV89_01790 [Solemya velum gill symbiont]OOY39277.1 hypothetical protein BOV90_10120 [Solemya velum gill symbiont]OOY45184.1 hypothetical protein BOV92_06275 [Solemya velum gill symbiont]
MKYIKLLTIPFLAICLGGCIVGETAAFVVKAPFEVADAVIPGSAGDAVESTGEAAAWVTDAVIPF